MKAFRIAASIGFVAFVVFSFSLKRELRGNTAPQGLIQQGMAAPDFQTRDMHGNPVVLYDALKDHKAIVLTFWATWCDPCRSELSNLEKIYGPKKAAGFEVMAVNLDPAQLPYDASAKNLPFPVVLDPDQSIAKAYGVQSLPSSVIVTATPRLVLRSFGGPNVLGVDRLLSSMMRSRQ